MEVKRGQIVKSIAGRDKGGFQVVLKLEPPYAFVCDGKRRRLEKPKRKKLIHLSMTKAVLEEEKLLNNRQVKVALKEFNNLSDDETIYR